MGYCHQLCCELCARPLAGPPDHSARSPMVVIVHGQHESKAFRVFPGTSLQRMPSRQPMQLIRRETARARLHHRHRSVDATQSPVQVSLSRADQVVDLNWLALWITLRQRHDSGFRIRSVQRRRPRGFASSFRPAQLHRLPSGERLLSWRLSQSYVYWHPREEAGHVPVLR